MKVDGKGKKKLGYITRFLRIHREFYLLRQKKIAVSVLERVGIKEGEGREDSKRWS